MQPNSAGKGATAMEAWGGVSPMDRRLPKGLKGDGRFGRCTVS